MDPKSKVSRTDESVADLGPAGVNASDYEIAMRLQRRFDEEARLARIAASKAKIASLESGSSSKKTEQKSELGYTAGCSREQFKRNYAEMCAEEHQKTSTERGCRLGFQLTKCKGIDDTFNKNCLSFSDILSERVVVNGKILRHCESIQFNYMVDLPWLMFNYPQELRRCPLLVVHGMGKEVQSELNSQAAQYNGRIRAKMQSEGFGAADIPQNPIRVFSAPMNGARFGVHHTKMMILFYKEMGSNSSRPGVESVRVVVHTANLIERDWEFKTQGVYVSQPFPLKSQASAKAREVNTPSVFVNTFEQDLIRYLKGYRSPDVFQTYINRLKQFDFSFANVALIPSVPGYHEKGRFEFGNETVQRGPESKHGKLSDFELFGHLRLRSLLRQLNENKTPSCEREILVGQFSSIGKLGKDPTKWLTGEFLQSLCGGRSVKNADERLKLVYPTVEDVKKSLEGYAAGGSLPYRGQQTHKTQLFLEKFLHRWQCEPKGNEPYSGRSLAMPHIKSYLSYQEQSKSLNWAVLTSANLSKAAWGAQVKNGTKLMVNSYEMGVLFHPKILSLEKKEARQLKIGFESSKSSSIVNIPIPYSLPPTAYCGKDAPWVVDRNYLEPDSNGQIWQH
eukprot:Nk52_evm8s370 gene=Nk52_evmTU8s370